MAGGSGSGYETTVTIDCVCGHVSVQTPSAEQEGECMPFAAIGAFVKKEYAGIGVEIIGVEILQA